MQEGRSCSLKSRTRKPGVREGGGLAGFIVVVFKTEVNFGLQDPKLSLLVGRTAQHWGCSCPSPRSCWEHPKFQALPAERGWGSQCKVDQDRLAQPTSRSKPAHPAGAV